MVNGSMMTRRALLAAGVASFALPLHAAVPQIDSVNMLGKGALVGWATLDLATGHGAAEHPDLRLPMCSSFKWLLAACILSRVDQNRERLDRKLRFQAADLLDYAPATRATLTAAGGVSVEMSIATLCKAAVTLSDNTAANLLLNTIPMP